MNLFVHSMFNIMPPKFLIYNNHKEWDRCLWANNMDCLKLEHHVWPFPLLEKDMFELIVYNVKAAF